MLEVGNALDVIAEVTRRRGEARSYLVAIDGADGVGKSPLGTITAFETRGMPVPLDMFLSANGTVFRFEDLKRALERTRAVQRCVVVEGAFSPWALRLLELCPDLTVYVERTENDRRERSRYFDADPDDPEAPFRSLASFPLHEFSSRRMADLETSSTLFHQLVVYHQEFKPRTGADILVTWPSFRMAG